MCATSYTSEIIQNSLNTTLMSQRSVKRNSLKKRSTLAETEVRLCVHAVRGIWG